MDGFIFNVQRFASISGGDYTIKSGGIYDIAKGYSGTITIDTSAAVTINGADSGNLYGVNIVTSSSTVNLTIKDLAITNSSSSVIEFGDGANNKLILNGTSTLKTTNELASAISNGGGLTIEGTGTLNVSAKCGAAIGSMGAGHNKANSDLEALGDIVINGGTINASATYGAAIGSGNGNYIVGYDELLNSVGKIVINGGTVNANSTDGSGIGTGWFGGSVDDIIINDGTIIANGYDEGTGIGGSANRGAKSITINGGTITATGKNGAGIGGNLDGDLMIKNGIIIAKSGCGAGIGASGNDFGSGGEIEGNIIISGGNIIALTGTAAEITILGEDDIEDGGSAIGGGRNGTVNGDIIINGTANVTAIAGKNAAAIGSGYSDGGWVNYTDKLSAYDSIVGDIKIGGDATVTAISEYNCVGIGAGPTHDGGGGIKGALDTDDTSPYGSGGVTRLNYTVGTITFEGETSTTDTSKVTIVSGDILKTIMINGKKYSGESKMIFVDGKKSEDDFSSNIMAGGRYVLPENFIGTLTINTTEAVIIDGSNAGELSGVNIVVNSSTANLTIRNLSITNNSSNVIKFGSSTGNKLTLTGTNKLITNAEDEAAIHLGGGLTIDGDGSLEARANGTYGGAGIGNDRTEKNSTANITINGGEIIASGVGGAGIGSGQYSSLGNISIGGTAKITATSQYGAGIGSGWGGSSGSVKNIIISDSAKVTASSYSGAGVGAGNGGEFGNISIGGSTIIEATSTNGGAGLGSGENASGGKISISDTATVTATAEKFGAGIGSGHVTSGKKSIGNITVGGDATVTAVSSSDGVGIGTGYADEDAENVTGTINISADTATSAKNVVTVQNSDTDREITINGKKYSGAEITFTDGVALDEESSGSYYKADTFIYSGGNVVITNYSGEDTVQIKSGKVDSWSFAGTDLVFKIGDGTLTLKGMKNHAVTVKDSTGTSTKLYSSDYTPQDAIKKLMNFLTTSGINGYNDKSAMDAAVACCSRFKNFQDLIDSFVADCRTAGDAEKFLIEYCGIILDNTDTGAITGWDAGGLKIKTSKDIIPETLPAATLSNYSGETFVKRNFTVYLPERAEGFEELSDDKKRVLNGAYSWWVEESLKLIEESYGINFSDGGRINLYVLDDESQHPYGVRGFWGIVSGGGMYIDMSDTYFEDDSDLDANGVDRLFAHEFTHVAYSDFIKGYLTEGLAELTHGIDDWRTYEIRRLAGDADLLERHMSGQQSSYAYSAGYMLWRYLAKQASDIELPVFGNITAKVQLKSSQESYFINAEKKSEVATTTGTVQIGISDGRNYTAENIVAQSLKAGNEGWTITATNFNDTVITGSGDDLIYAGAGSDVINAGAGNDVIDYFVGHNMSVNAGAGNDTIYSENSVMYYNTYKNNTLDGGADDDYIDVDVSGGYTTAFGGAGNDTLKYGSDFNYWDGGAGDDYLYFWGKSSTVHGGSGNDTITNCGYGYTVEGNIIFYGDDGDDVIELVENNKITNLTIVGGKGNDTLSGSNQGEIFQYTSGDGNDLITNFDANDTLQITEGKYKTLTSGNDVIVHIGSGSITLEGAKNIALNIDGGAETDTIPAGISISNATLTASTAFTGNKIDLADYATTVTKVNASALSRGISILGTAAANSLKGSKGADTISGGAGNDTVSLGGGNDIYIYQSGNDLIQDYTTGADKIKLVSASITGSSLSGNNVTLKTSTGNITVKNGKGTNITIVDATGKETSQIYPSVVPEPTPSSDLTYDAKKTAVTLASSFSGTLEAADYASTVKKIDASKISKAINIFGNAQANTILGSSKADTIYGGTGNDSISGSAGNDKLYGDAGADTLYGGTSADTLTGGDGKDVFIYSNGDGADVIADFTTGQDSIKLTSGTIASASLKSSDMVFKIGSGSLTIKNGKGKEISIGSSIYYNNLVYDAKKTTVTLASGFTGSLKAADYASTVKKIDASAVSKSVNLVGNAQTNTIIGGSKAETIYGGTGNDSINGNAGNDKLYGDAGADTLYGGAGADTLTGGDGKDVFVYSDGDGADVIADFTAGQDSIKLTSGTVASTSLKGSDMVLKIGSGSLTIKNGKGKEISVGSSIYYNNFVYDTKKTAVTLASGFTGSLKAADYASTVKKIDASAISKSVNLVGNAQANTIIGGSKAETIYGGTGNDSINGGSGNDKLYGEVGNDTLWGGAGNDTFVYGTGEGKDVIADYAAGDTIKISSGTITATGYKSNDVVFTVGSGTLTVKNGKGKAITITDASNKTSTKTYTTGVTYGSNGSRSSNALWFTEDDTNFIDETNLDAISTANYSVTNVEAAASTSDLAQNDLLFSSALTFAAK